MSFSRSALFFFILFSLPLIIRAQSDIDHWETVVFNDDTWSYRVGTSAPPSNWMQPQFNDQAWATGRGGFGYGDGDDNTTIPRTLSVCIRIKFDLPDTAKIRMAVLHADYDDAFIAYLNGTEIARANAGPPGTVLDHNDIPPTDREATLYQGGLPEAYPVYPSSFEPLIRQGENTLAIQVNNFLITSSDLSSNFFLSLGITDSTRGFRPTPSWFFLPFLGSHLPLISIDTRGREIVDEPRIIAQMKVIEHGAGRDNYVNDPGTDYEGRISIEIRGASSQMFEKKNYSLETQNPNGDNNNVSLLGMPKENDWVLHGPYSDKSLIRNALTFHIGREMMDYASRTRFCELAINSEYQGVYLLMERIKRDGDRVDIANLRSVDTTGDELTGGYIIQLDRDDPNVDDDGWYSPYGSNPFYAYHHPDFDQLLPVQKAYIRDWISRFEDAMTRPDFASTYQNYIDVHSFIDYFLINELAKHIDAFKLSFYMYKEKDSDGGKLHMGPIWDFNLGYGNFDFVCNPNPDGWIYPCTSRAFWVNKILDIPAVQNRMYCRWQELRRGALSTRELTSRIDDYVTELGPAVDRNFGRFQVLGEYVWPNDFVGNTHAEEITFLKNWLTQRLVWMDTHMFGDRNTDCEALVNLVEPGGSKVLQVYPNPFEDYVIWKVAGGNGRDGEVRIFDVRGQYITRKKLTHQTSLDLRVLSSGMYFYEFSIGDQVLQMGKLIKQ